MILAFLALLATAQDEVEDREDDMFGGSEDSDDSDDDSNREDDMFGGDTDEGGREDDLFGQSLEPQSTTAADLLAKIEDADDNFQIGGSLWLRMQGAVADKKFSGPDDIALTSPNLLTLFADARPNDRVRAYVRGRLQHDWTVIESDDAAAEDLLFGAAEQNTVLLDQMWIKFDVKQSLFTTIGRQRVKWGAGRFWNPTDFVNQQRLDPLAIQDLRIGVSAVKLHLPIESAGANFYALANLDEATALDEIGGAFRGEIVFGQTEFTVSSALRKNNPVRIGADVSSGVSILDVRVEGAVIHGDESLYWRGQLDPPNLAFPSERDRSDDWIPQVVAGVEFSARYSDQDNISFGAEYFYNDAGYSNSRLYPWMFFTGSYTPFYVGRHYLAAYSMLAGPGRWDDHSFTASYITNLSDSSNVARLDYRGNVLTWLDVNAFYSMNFGGNGEFHYRLKMDPVPEFALPLLDDTELEPYKDVLAEKILVPAPLATFGLGASVRF